MMAPSFGRHGIDPPALVLELHLEAAGRGSREGGDEVDVGMLAGPHVGSVGGRVHGRVVDGPGQGGPVDEHLLEERLVAADAHRDDAQDPPLEIGNGFVEGVEQRGDPGHGRLGEHLVVVAVREAGAQRMAGGTSLAQLSISFQSATSAVAAVSTSRPV